MSIPPTHPALYTIAPGGALEIRQIPTRTPGPGEILLKVEWTSSGPFDLHIADGWLLNDAPRVTGSPYAGTVISTHPSVTALSPGDRVFGFYHGPNPEDHAHQTHAVVPAWSCGKIPANLSAQEAVTAPENVVTIFQAAKADLGLDLPWPKPDGHVPAHADTPILIWGGGGSVGQYAVQVFAHWGYRNILATASARNREMLLAMGASGVFDYRDPDVVERILASVPGRRIPFIFDAVGHRTGTIDPLARLAQPGDRVAVVLPVVMRDATETQRPEFEMDARDAGEWREGVTVSGIRAHFYPRDETFRERLQPEVVPKLLETGAVRPNKVRLVEGRDMLERAKRVLEILRRKEVSAERLVWRVSEEDE